MAISPDWGLQNWQCVLIRGQESWQCPDWGAEKLAIRTHCQLSGSSIRTLPAFRIPNQDIASFSAPQLGLIASFAAPQLGFIATYSGPQLGNIASFMKPQSGNIATFLVPISTNLNTFPLFSLRRGLY